MPERHLGIRSRRALVPLGVTAWGLELGRHDRLVPAPVGEPDDDVRHRPIVFAGPVPAHDVPCGEHETGADEASGSLEVVIDLDPAPEGRSARRELPQLDEVETAAGRDVRIVGQLDPACAHRLNERVDEIVGAEVVDAELRGVGVQGACNRGEGVHVDRSGSVVAVDDPEALVDRRGRAADDFLQIVVCPHRRSPRSARSGGVGLRLTHHPLDTAACVRAQEK